MLQQVAQHLSQTKRPSQVYALNLVEGEFCELRDDGVLRSSRRTGVGGIMLTVKRLARRVLGAGRKKRSRPYATYSCSASCLGAVLDRRGIRWLGATRLPYGTRAARAVPRAVLPGWPRPRRGAADTLARLLPSPRPDRLLGRSQVARWQPSAGGDPRPLGWFLYPLGAPAAQ